MAPVTARELHGKFHTLPASGDRCHVSLVLFRGKDLLEDGTKLNFTQDAPGLDPGKNLLEAAHIRS